MIPRLLAAILLGSLAACAAPDPLRNTELPQAVRESPDDYLVVAVRNEAPVGSARAGATVRGYDAVPAYGATASGARLIEMLARDYAVQTVAGWPIAGLHLECAVFRSPKGTAAALLERLQRDPRVRLAEPLHEYRTLADDHAGEGYNDPYAPLQKNIPILGLESAHRVARGTGVRVAVVDTGVGFDHPDLAGSVVERHDYVGGDEDAFRHDLHGTAVAGVIAARAGNHLGIVGVAPEAQIIALKACWQQVGAPHAVCNTFTLAQAIAQAIDSRARIVNLSLTGPADPLLAQLVALGNGRGVLFVGAVPPGGRVAGFPSEAPGVLAVDRAEAPTHAEGILYAPGEGVLTLTPGGHYDFASGSSMAAAEVTGLLALLIERRPLDAVAARTLLAGSTTRVGGADSGSVSACGALAATRHQSCAEFASSTALFDERRDPAAPDPRHSTAIADGR